jgi:hypothetical protein
MLIYVGLSGLACDKQNRDEVCDKKIGTRMAMQMFAVPRQSHIHYSPCRVRLIYILFPQVTPAAIHI